MAVLYGASDATNCCRRALLADRDSEQIMLGRGQRPDDNRKFQVLPVVTRPFLHACARCNE